MHEKWPPEHEDWSSRSEELAQSPAQSALPSKRLTRAGKPTRAAVSIRATWTLTTATSATWSAITFHIQDMTEVLADVIWNEDMPFIIPLPYSEPLAEALAAVGRRCSVRRRRTTPTGRPSSSTAGTRGGRLP